MNINAGISPDFKQSVEQVESTEQEQKSVKDALISAYEKNISTRLKAELCNSDVNNYANTKESSTSNSLWNP